MPDMPDMPDMPESAERVVRWVAYFLGWVAVLFGIWFVLVDSLAHIEVAVGPLAALLAAWAALRVRRHGGMAAWRRARKRTPGVDDRAPLGSDRHPA